MEVSRRSARVTRATRETFRGALSESRGENRGPLCPRYSGHSLPSRRGEVAPPILPLVVRILRLILSDDWSLLTMKRAFLQRAPLTRSTPSLSLPTTRD